MTATLDLRSYPVSDDGTMLQIDWQFAKEVAEADNAPSKPRQPDDLFEFKAEDFMDAVVMPSYRNIDQPQYFYVAEIRSDLNPVSPFPSPELYKTFAEYYATKYGLVITNLEQPLLDVDHTSARLNLLIPRYMNQKGVPLPTSSAETKKARRENLQQKQILVPELCDIHVFLASLWRKAVCLPAILYRMNYLLIGEEIRKHISKETKIGISELPNDYRFPKLDFGIDTSPEHLKLLTETVVSAVKNAEETDQNESINKMDEWTGKTEACCDAVHKPTMDNIDTNIWEGVVSHSDIQGVSSAGATSIDNISDSFSEMCNVDHQSDHSVNDQCNTRSLVNDSQCNKCVNSAINSTCDSEHITANTPDTFQPDDIDSDTEARTTSTENKKNTCKSANDVCKSKIVDRNEVDNKDTVEGMQEAPAKQNGFTCEETDYKETASYDSHEDESLNISKKENLMTNGRNGFKNAAKLLDGNVEAEIEDTTKMKKEDLEIADIFSNIEKFVPEKNTADDDICPEPLISLDEDTNLSTFIGPSPCEILQALTMSNANDFFSLERLETIGDSFLKYAITVYLYCQYPGIHEGKLSYLRSKQVSNYNLYRLGKRKGLAECMISTKFEPYENWLPPGYVINEERRKGPVPKVFVTPLSIHKSSSTLFSNQKSFDSQHSGGDRRIRRTNTEPDLELKFQTELEEADQIARAKDEEFLKGDRSEAQQNFIPYSLQLHHCLPDKSIADCMEALIGCYLTSCDKMAALHLMSWMGLKVLPKKKFRDGESAEVNMFLKQ